MAAPSFGMIQEVCVMLVDDDKRFVTEMVDLLKSYDYKVTTVGTASTAMAMLSKGNTKIDVMIISVHSSNLLSFKLLAQAVALDIISLFISDEDNELLAKKALDEGAYLYIKKPFDEEIVKCLWQFVLRKKLQREKAREGSKKNGDQMNVGDTIEDNEEQPGEKKNISNIEEQSNNIYEAAENDIVLNRKYEPRRKRGFKSMKQINEEESQSIVVNKVVKKKACIEWTVDLHAKFMKVVQQLGEERCFPKEILEEMKVSGLTKRQVASHLQKCRTNNWRASKERKSIFHPSHQGPSSGSQKRSSFRKFGTMPCLQTNVSNLQHNSAQTLRGQDFPFPTLSTDNIFARGESSIQQQLYRPQLQVQPDNLNIDSPFNNPFLLALNNIGSRIQQQHGSFFEMLSPQGLQGPIIENTTYRPGLMFDSGDHHTQSNFNLDLNEAHGTYSDSGTMFGTDIGNATVNDSNLNVNVDNVTTYSGSTTMSDAYVGNITINGSGAPNINFQQYIGESNMSDPSNIIATSYASGIVGSDSNEKENCDAYFDFNNMNNLFQNLGPPSANLPNEQGSEFNQVCFDDQVTTTSSVQFPGIANYSDESSI